MLIISDISCLLGIYHRYLSPYSNHSNENGYKKGCPRALVTYIFVFSHSQIPLSYCIPNLYFRIYPFANIASLFLLSNNSYKNLKAARLRGSFREI